MSDQTLPLCQDTLAKAQEEIGAWHLATFGECSNKRTARKLLEEAAEFMCANLSAVQVRSCGNDGVMRTESEWEAGDIFIVLMAWAHRNGVDLLAVARRRCRMEGFTTASFHRRSLRCTRTAPAIVTWGIAQPQRSFYTTSIFSLTSCGA